MSLSMEEISEMMESTRRMRSQSINFDKARVVMSFGIFAAIVVGVWVAATFLSDIRNDIRSVKEDSVRHTQERDADRAELRKLGSDLVTAINRITAIEARGGNR